ncbi:MAG: translation initiation factor IF-3 [Chloroflexi bacterium]|nr:translation initiation factor IF-3 [Chloroflexota bacterium]
MICSQNGIGGRRNIKEIRINERVEASEVRLIDENGDQVGVVPYAEALRIAQERDLDLVEVAPNAVPPVCRLADYGRYRYEQTKRDRAARRRQHLATIKEVRMSPTTEPHDLATKLQTIERFLEAGDKVKVTIRFRGRQMAHPQLGRQLLEQIVSHLQGKAKLERIPIIEGRSMTMIVAPAVKREHATQPL